MTEAASTEPLHSAGHAPPDVVRLVGANLPADQGLSSLGLLMQLGGSLTAAFVTFIGFQTLFLPVRLGGMMLVVLLLTTLGVVRSLMHRAAGTGLLYGQEPLRGVRRYIAVALIHSALFSAVLITQELSSVRLALCMGAAQAVWPLVLLGILRMPRIRRFEHEVPSSEDKGFEGASVLMTVFSIAGIGIGLLMLNALVSMPGAFLDMRVLLVLTMLLFLARSITHLIAGVTGLRNVPLDTAVERVGQYANLGVVSAFVASGVLLITSMSGRFGFTGLLTIAVTGWMLAVWPMALRRFFAERQFASLLAGDAAPIHRRAPDAGLTSLGWLLISLGSMMLAITLAAAGGSPDNDSTSRMLLPLLFGGNWQTAVIGALSVYAGFELVRMTKHHRTIATACAVAMGLLQLTTWAPGWQHLGQLDVLFYNPSALVTVISPLGLALATLILVNRKIAPMAHAKIRRPHP
jgi:hypothetical protein